MTQITVEIVNVGKVESVPTKNGRSYNTIEIVYKNQGKIEGKKLVSFSNPSVFNTAKELSTGDMVTVGLEKNEGGYWQWTSITKGGSTTETIHVAPAQEGGTSVTQTKSVSNYETREERQERQQFIIRQSSLSSAIEFLKGQKGATLNDVLETATVLVEFVNGHSKRSTEPFADMESDIPFN